jgi:nucleotide-binding universal stress UspA family protein
MMILICYDGSADAQAAIDRAGSLMANSEARVLVIWETVLETMTRTGSMGMGMGSIGVYDGDEADAAMEKAAHDTATDGVQRAVSAGLSAKPQIARRHSDITAAILAAATEVDADVIVLGTRGLGGVKSLMLGSVSHAVLHHADRPVLVVPSAGFAEPRHSWTAEAQVAGGVT